MAKTPNSPVRRRVVRRTIKSTKELVAEAQNANPASARKVGADERGKRIAAYAKEKQVVIANHHASSRLLQLADQGLPLTDFATFKELECWWCHRVIAANKARVGQDFFIRCVNSNECEKARNQYLSKRFPKKTQNRSEEKTPKKKIIRRSSTNNTNTQKAVVVEATPKRRVVVRRKGK